MKILSTLCADFVVELRSQTDSLKALQEKRKVSNKKSLPLRRLNSHVNFEVVEPLAKESYTGYSYYTSDRRGSEGGESRTK